MKVQCILTQSSQHAFLKSFLDLESAQNFAIQECALNNAIPDLLDTVRNDLCDRGAFMQGNFLQIAHKDDWSVAITVQSIPWVQTVNS